jgi:hypothetical protein
MKLKKLETEKELEKAIILSKRKNQFLYSQELNDDISPRWKRAESKIHEIMNKYLDLVWYARKNPEELLKEERYEILNLIKDYEEKYPEETSDLNSEEGNWHHGFNSGMLAATRLVIGMMNKQFIEYDEIEFDENPFNDEILINEEGIAGYIYDEYDDALENFPELDS